MSSPYGLILHAAGRTRRATTKEHRLTDDEIVVRFLLARGLTEALEHAVGLRRPNVDGSEAFEVDAPHSVVLGVHQRA